MKLLLTILGAITVLVGCAVPGTPTEPGTGRGLQYVPMVTMQGVDPARYDEDVAACRTAAARIDVRNEANVDNMWYAAYVGLVTWYSRGLATGFAVGGIGVSGVDYAGRPNNEVIADNQQTGMVHCMTKRGYRNLDPNVQDTFYTNNYFTAQTPVVPRRTGIDTYNVEKMAKAGRCNLQPRAVLTGKGPGYEAYNVPCDNGGTWAVRCEFGQCRVLAQAPMRRTS